MPASVVPESALLTRARAKEIFHAAASVAQKLGVRDLEAMVGAGTHALTRFANNTIHQNVAERSGYLSVRALVDKRTARASTNRLDAEGIRRVVEEAITLTRLAKRKAPPQRNTPSDTDHRRSDSTCWGRPLPSAHPTPRPRYAAMSGTFL